MTVKEMIQELQKHPEETEVLLRLEVELEHDPLPSYTITRGGPAEHLSIGTGHTLHGKLWICGKSPLPY